MQEVALAPAGLRVSNRDSEFSECALLCSCRSVQGARPRTAAVEVSSQRICALNHPTQLFIGALARNENGPGGKPACELSARRRNGRFRRLTLATESEAVLRSQLHLSRRIVAQGRPQ